MFDILDRQTTLTRNQKKLALIATWAVCLEFLDYFLIGFILTFVSAPWELSFGQSSFVLLSSGIGAIFGALYFGRLADRIGRRKVFLITITVFTLATGALVFTPDDPQVGWLYLVLFRVVVGFGAGGLYVVDLPLVQEFMPAAKRGKVTGLVTSAVPAGFLVGSLLVWLLSDAIGWRGILVVATVLGMTVLLLRLSIPESPRYLARMGDAEGARRSIAWALEVAPESLPLAVPEVHEQRKVGIAQLFKYRRSFWVSTLANLGIQTGYYGITLWTPTLLVLVMGIDPAQSGFYMVFITLGALAGRFGLSFLSERIGRRRTGTLAGLGAAGFLMVAAMLDHAMLGGLSVFFLIMIVVYFFGEGGFAVVGPYSGEIWPSSLRTTGMGFAYGIGGIGKVIGPLGLALIIGSSNLVKPEVAATELVPAFGYFAIWYLLCAAMFAFFGIETKDKTLEALDRELESQRREPSAITR
ncbi:MFS transporter [Georgenia sp. H159]|uniref:MFS transporter n=1 Tax=Georgenia sp. H159 TaxID=3076115 RepID=UPI002D797782|nr:MFS transporter [Georgenia sp. H159]